MITNNSTLNPSDVLGQAVSKMPIDGVDIEYRRQAGDSAQAPAYTVGFFRITEAASKEEMHLALEIVCRYHRDSLA